MGRESEEMKKGKRTNPKRTREGSGRAGRAERRERK
jgi:hypothetical protein